MSVLTDLEKWQIGQWGSLQNPLVDPNVQTIPAGVFTPNYPITRTDTGTAAMTGITVPYAGFSGTIIITPGGAFTWTTATNIAVAGTAVANRAVHFTYDPIRIKWYPSYV
jgi:hypothetical protein